MGNWRDGGIDIGDMRRLTAAFDHRLGHTWARGRLKLGDVIVAIRHAGDCFHEYLLLEHTVGSRDGEPRLFLKPVPLPFGAYVMGEPMGRLEMKELGLAMAGQEFSIDVPAHMPEVEVPQSVKDLTDHVRRQALSPAPDFDNKESIFPGNRIHDWRSHVGEAVAEIWDQIPEHVRLAIAADADHLASQEEYD